MLEGLEARGKRRHADLDRLPIPYTMQDIWLMFNEIASGRQTDQGFPQPIPASEVIAWSQAKQWPLSPWEFELIRLLDQTYIRVYVETRPQ